MMNWEQLRHLPPEVFASLVFGEIVYYGGFIGGVIAMLLYCRQYKVPVQPVADLFAPALAAAHGIGRVGCFFGGCCHGIPVNSSHPFAVVFPPSYIVAPTGVPLLATQLIEAVCLFIIAVILAIAYKKTAGTGLTACLYGILYSILRFILEFYRGDPARGIYGPFSTSQYISIALFAVSAILITLVLKRMRPPTSIH
jgi:phosphatidylglycerol:prolipoprotein diacylglycerol transferase